MLHGHFQAVINNSSGGVNLTPYSGVIFFEVILTPKRKFKELFFRSKNNPRFRVNIEELKYLVTPKKGLPVPKIFTPIL